MSPPDNLGLPKSVPPLLGAVAAIVDIAPTAAVVLAGVDEQPAAAVLVGALAEPAHVFRLSSAEELLGDARSLQ